MRAFCSMSKNISTHQINLMVLSCNVIVKKQSTSIDKYCVRSRGFLNNFDAKEEEEKEVQKKRSEEEEKRNSKSECSVTE